MAKKKQTTKPAVNDISQVNIGYKGEVTVKLLKGKKVVTYNGVNVFDKIKPNSTWLQLAAGDNSFSINSDDESKNNMSFSLIYKQRYV